MPPWSALQVGESGAFDFEQILRNDGNAQGGGRDVLDPPAVPIAQSAGLAQFASHADVGHLLIEEHVEIGGGSLFRDATDRTAALAERFQQRKVDRGFFKAWQSIAPDAHLVYNSRPRTGKLFA